MDQSTNPARRRIARAVIGTALAWPAAKVLQAAVPAHRGTLTAEGVSFVVYLTTRPEQRERTRRMVFDIFQAMSSEPDFVRAWIHEDLTDSDTIVNYETWACSREFFLENHLKRPYRQAFEAAVPELLSAERRIVFLKTIGAFPRRVPTTT